MDEITLEDYKKRLRAHDKWYMMSDDPRVYSKGYEEYTALRNMSMLSPEFKQAFDDELGK